MPVSPLGYGALSGLFRTSQPAVGSLLSPTLKAAVKRKAFFSFHYDDIMRVNVVRNAWKIDHPDNALMRSFQDSSLWESRKLEGDDAVKRLIREGVEYTSAVCVLIGTETWLRRWVRYEIARAIVDGRGLLGVHLNSIRHHHTKTPHTRGYNPLEFLAVGKVQQAVLSTPRYYLYEKQAVPNGIGGYKWDWNLYKRRRATNRSNVSSFSNQTIRGTTKSFATSTRWPKPTISAPLRRKRAKRITSPIFSLRMTVS